MDFVVGSVINVLKKEGERAGKIQLQKIIYFLEYLDVKIPYSFVISRYGPFSAELSEKINQMENRQWIIRKDRSGTDYELNLEEEELENYERQDFNEVSEKIKEVIDIFPSLSFRNLELYATVHYCFDSLKLFYDNVENDILVEEVKKYKDDKFREEDILDAYSILKKEKLLR